MPDEAAEHAAFPSAGSEPRIGGLTLEVVEGMAIRQTLGITEKSIYNKMARLGLR